MKIHLAIVIAAVFLTAACEARLPLLGSPAAPTPTPVSWDDRAIFEPGLVPEARPILEDLEAPRFTSSIWRSMRICCT